uniref:Uncharacterized protein n=1 Tax=Arundo donax TaxID=35708 RepID=A0A0A9C9K2_ARUDO
MNISELLPTALALARSVQNYINQKSQTT